MPGFPFHRDFHQDGGHQAQDAGLIGDEACDAHGVIDPHVDVVAKPHPRPEEVLETEPDEQVILKIEAPTWLAVGICNVRLMKA